MKPFFALSCLLLAAAELSAQRYEPASLPGSRPRPQQPDTGVYEVPMDQSDAMPSPSEDPSVGADARTPRPQPQDLWSVSLRVIRDESLIAKIESSDLGKKFLGVMIADLDDGMVAIPGLGLLLDTEIVLGASYEMGAATFDFGPVRLPFAVFLQGIGIAEDAAAATGVAKLAAGQ